MPDFTRQILVLLTPRERTHLVGVLLAMLLMGFAQMAGVGVVLPFVSLLANPAYVHENPFLDWFYLALGFDSIKSFQLFVGSCLLVVLIGSNIVTACTVWGMTRFSWGVQKRISARLLKGYLHQPYERVINRNSAETGKNILIESQQFANGVMIPVLKALAFGITAVMIVAFLFWLKPLLALVITLIFGGAYFLVYLTIRRVLLAIGRRRLVANTARFQAVNEAFGSVKEVKVLGRENHFLKRYDPAATTFARAMAQSQILGQVPRYVIEGLAFGIIMAAMLYLLAKGYDLQSTLPLASAFIVAGYRLLPALQNIYQGIATTRFNQSVLDTLTADLVDRESRREGRRAKQPADNPRREKLPFEKNITLQNLRYCYPNAAAAAIDDVTLTISRNSFVAFTGATGAGKTTLADIILGLLCPDSGQIMIDETPLTATNRARWQANLGYVPQDIYLVDNSVTSNIAYGLAPEDIDHQAVERAARIANIHDFIISQLPSGYDTIVGERGVRLSGGQRQRIGIARALYHDPDVIVLDEATSALDNETERRIVNELDTMRGGRTLIVIAHRLTTIQKCSKIFLLHDGRLKASGTYHELVEGNHAFDRLVKAGQSR